MNPKTTVNQTCTRPKPIHFNVTIKRNRFLDALNAERAKKLCSKYSALKSGSQKVNSMYLS